MKKTLAILLLCSAALLAPSPRVEAQTTLTAVPTTKQETALTRGYTRHNRETCISVGLLEGCTQAAARTAWIAQQNGRICTSLTLGPACTETAAKTQWCAMLGFQGTATCTHPDGRGSAQVAFVTAAPQIDVFTTLQSFWDRKAIKTVLDEYVRKSDEEDAAAIAAAETAIKTSGTVAEKNAYCLAIKKPAGCLP